MLLLPHQLLLSLGIIAIAAAQQNFTALIKSRPELSNLSTYFDLHPELVESVLRWPNRTFLAPDDEAFVKETPENYMFGPPPQYYRCRRHHYGRSLQVPHAGPVVVGNGAGGQHPIFTSGSQSVSTVVVPDLEYEGGIVHIVDKFLTIPPSVLELLQPLGLTAAQGALTKATDLGSQLPQPTLTLFVPTNAAFEAVGSVLTDMSNTQLRNVMGYHIVPGVVDYLDPFHNLSLPTLISEAVHIVAEDGNVFVNSAEAVIHNVLAAEGVIHIIDNVLNPSNTTAVPDSTATSQAPAFSGATPLSGGVVPFTSGSLAASSSASTGGLSTGAKAGVGIGVAFDTVLVIALAVLFGLHRKCSKRASYAKQIEAISSPREFAAEHALQVVENMPMKDVRGKQKMDRQTAGSDSDWGLELPRGQG